MLLNLADECPQIFRKIRCFPATRIIIIRIDTYQTSTELKVECFSDHLTSLRIAAITFIYKLKA